MHLSELRGEVVEELVAQHQEIELLKSAGMEQQASTAEKLEGLTGALQGEQARRAAWEGNLHGALRSDATRQDLGTEALAVGMAQHGILLEGAAGAVNALQVKGACQAAALVHMDQRMAEIVRDGEEKDQLMRAMMDRLRVTDARMEALYNRMLATERDAGGADGRIEHLTTCLDDVLFQTTQRLNRQGNSIKTNSECCSRAENDLAILKKGVWGVSMGSDRAPVAVGKDENSEAAIQLLGAGATFGVAPENNLLDLLDAGTTFGAGEGASVIISRGASIDLFDAGTAFGTGGHAPKSTSRNAGTTFGAAPEMSLFGSGPSLEAGGGAPEINSRGAGTTFGAAPETSSSDSGTFCGVEGVAPEIALRGAGTTFGAAPVMSLVDWGTPFEAVEGAPEIDLQSAGTTFGAEGGTPEIISLGVGTTFGATPETSLFDRDTSFGAAGGAPENNSQAAGTTFGAAPEKYLFDLLDASTSFGAGGGTPKINSWGAGATCGATSETSWFHADPSFGAGGDTPETSSRGAGTTCEAAPEMSLLDSGTPFRDGGNEPEIKARGAGTTFGATPETRLLDWGTSFEVVGGAPENNLRGAGTTFGVVPENNLFDLLDAGATFGSGGGAPEIDSIGAGTTFGATPATSLFDAGTAFGAGGVAPEINSRGVGTTSKESLESNMSDSGTHFGAEGSAPKINLRVKGTTCGFVGRSPELNSFGWSDAGGTFGAEADAPRLASVSAATGCTSKGASTASGKEEGELKNATAASDKGRGEQPKEAAAAAGKGRFLRAVTENIPITEPFRQALGAMDLVANEMTPTLQKLRASVVKKFQDEVAGRAHDLPLSGAEQNLVEEVCNVVECLQSAVAVCRKQGRVPPSPEEGPERLRAWVTQQIRGLEHALAHKILGAVLEYMGLTSDVSRGILNQRLADEMGTPVVVLSPSRDPASGVMTVAGVAYLPRQEQQGAREERAPLVIAIVPVNGTVKQEEAGSKARFQAALNRTCTVGRGNVRNVALETAMEGEVGALLGRLPLRWTQMVPTPAQLPPPQLQEAWLDIYHLLTKLRTRMAARPASGAVDKEPVRQIADHVPALLESTPPEMYGPALAFALEIQRLAKEAGVETEQLWEKRLKGKAVPASRLDLAEDAAVRDRNNREIQMINDRNVERWRVNDATTSELQKFCPRGFTRGGKGGSRWKGASGGSHGGSAFRGAAMKPPRSAPGYE